MTTLFTARIAQAIGCAALAAIGSAVALGVAGPAAAATHRAVDNHAHAWELSVADVGGQLSGPASDDQFLAPGQNLTTLPASKRPPGSEGHSAEALPASKRASESRRTFPPV